MPPQVDPRLALQAVRARYNDPDVASLTDVWHRYTASCIRAEIGNWWNSPALGPHSRILNAGAGGNDLGVCPPWSVNLDISERRISSSPNPVVATVEAIPFADGAFDRIVCVGSVINYCDAAAAISEFGRVLKPQGDLIVEFESSESAELINTKAFGASAAIAVTFYGDREEVVWVYRRTYITELLGAAGLEVVRSVPIHVVSPWALLVLRSIRAATFAAHFDTVAGHMPVLKRWASNHLLHCQKRSA